ncbi:MAG: aldehyde dehydrogenase family protein [Nitrospiraceae bacterium]
MVCRAGADEASQATASTVEGAAASRQLPAHARASILAKTAPASAIAPRRVRSDHHGGSQLSPLRMPAGKSDAGFEPSSLPRRSQASRWRDYSARLVAGMESYWGMTRRFPLGAILGITPFNFPLNLVAHKVAPALAAGNAILIKPAPQTPAHGSLAQGGVGRGWASAGGYSVVPSAMPLPSS